MLEGRTISASSIYGGRRLEYNLLHYAICTHDLYQTDRDPCKDGEQLKIVRLLCKAGANPNELARRWNRDNFLVGPLQQYKVTPLHVAALNTESDPQIIEVLCDAGADVSIKTQQGNTALWLVENSFYSDKENKKKKIEILQHFNTKKKKNKDA